MDDRRQVIKLPHPEPLAQVSLKSLDIFLIYPQKQMLCVLIRSASESALISWRNKIYQIPPLSEATPAF